MNTPEAILHQYRYLARMAIYSQFGFQIGDVGNITVTQLLRLCNGYYQSPRGKDDQPLGPLVGYAGTYNDDTGKKRQYVGEVYYNFAALENYASVSAFVGSWLAQLISCHCHDNEISDVLLLGMPMGGLTLGTHCANALGVKFAYPEKEITAVATNTGREQSDLLMTRHEIPFGSNVIIVEDVCNSFSTTTKAQGLIEQSSSQLVAIACAMNRSGEKEWHGIPVLSAEHTPTMQYQQDDPYVAHHIAEGNISWKPKSDWAELVKAMSR